jgi:Protein of unknown function (DUF1566)
MFSIRNLVFSAAMLGAMISPPAQAIPVPGQGNWETTLQARDLDANGSVDAYYDTLANITWLANFNTNGLMDWNTANTWATTSSFFGVNGWRLPTVNETLVLGCETDLAGQLCRYNIALNTDMGHLLYVTLGNPVLCTPFASIGNCPPSTSPIFNTANLLNFEQSFYWSGTPVFTQDSPSAWAVQTQPNASPTFMIATNKSEARYAVALHLGDVGAPVPLPPTAALMALMFGAMALLLRKRAA